MKDVMEWDDGSLIEGEVANQIVKREDYPEANESDNSI